MKIIGKLMNDNSRQKRMRYLIKPLGIVPDGLQATAWFLSLKLLLLVALVTTDFRGAARIMVENWKDFSAMTF